MPYSRVTKEVWKEEQILVNLQVINLSYSKYLTEVPNLSGSVKVVKIYLQKCESLVEIPSYFQHLDKLTHLDLGECSSLKYLPEMPGNIQYLNLQCTGIKKLPESVWSNENISYLNIIRCKDLKILPSSRCKLKNLVELDLNGCSRFSEFPEILKPMEHVVSLSLRGTAVEKLPSSIGNLNRLQDLNLGGCKHLKDVPTSIYSLTNLKRLNFNGCWRLEKLPSSAVAFLSLEELDLSESGILEIPASIKQASRLSILHLNGCERLQSIPELPVLCNVKAECCTSLKIVSSSRTALTQGWDKPNYCFRVFTNCPELDNNSRSNIMDEAQITIMRMATVIPWPKIYIACPGKEIPNWFSYQNEGSSVDLELRPDWFRTGLFGFALAVVVSAVPGMQDDFILDNVRANFIVKFMGKSHKLFSSKYTAPRKCYHFCDGQRHVQVWNEPFRSEEVGKKCSPDVYKLAKEASVVFYPEYLSFMNENPAFFMDVESCGICPLYAEDAKKFIFPCRGDQK